MKILFNSNISEVRVFQKAKYYSSLCFGLGKRKIGRRFGIFPVYEKCSALFYDWGGDYWGELEDYNSLDRKTYVEVVDGEGRFYYKPHCTIYLNGGTHHEVYFETVDELTEYVNELKSVAEHIILK
jgi:hypothetical protein